MEIKKIISQHRRDFTAIYVCEHCGHEEKGSGYDDGHFHNVVIPQMKCKNCGEVSSGKSAPRVPKYADDVVV